MLRSKRTLLALALLACASFARAESLRLVAPAGGATLRGGAFAEVRWSAAQLPASAEEWEAFLSIDGGKYYAFRITPHLDIDLHRFTFVVPNVDTGNARILIRTGNERRETLFESPSTFVIERDAKAEQLLPGLLPAGRGEAARDGDPAVLAWTAGDRSGAGISQQSSPSKPAPAFRSRAKTAEYAPTILTPAGKQLVALPLDHWQPATGNRQPPTANCQPSTSTDLLLVCSRLNI